MNFIKQGSGKKILIFLHGWGGSWQSWGPIIEKLKKDFTIYALDLPGFGLSPLSKPYDLSDYDADISDFLKKEKITKPALIGHSFGGQVAAKFAIKHPEKLSKLVLVDAAVIRDNSSKMKLHIKIAHVGKNIIKFSPLSPFYNRFRKLYYQMRNIVTSESDYLKADNNPILQKTLANIMREDLSNELEKIIIPTLLFWGEKDHPDYTPISHAKIIFEKIKNSKLITVPNGGHFSFLDDQETFCKSIKEFI